MARTVWKTGICIAFGLVAGAAALVQAAEEPAGRPEPVLKHAVICPPFKGDPDLAARYHAELVALLKAEPGIEYLEGPRATGRKAPEFSYRINGAIVADEAGRPFVMVALVDEARKERIASHVAPASPIRRRWRRGSGPSRRTRRAVPPTCRSNAASASSSGRSRCRWTAAWVPVCSRAWCCMSRWTRNR